MPRFTGGGFSPWVPGWSRRGLQWNPGTFLCGLLLFPVISLRVSQDAVRALRVLHTLSACVHAPGRSLASVCSQRCPARAAAADTPPCQGRRRGPVLPEQRPCPRCPQCHPSGRSACTWPKEQPPFSERPGEHRAGASLSLWVGRFGELLKMAVLAERPHTSR